MSSPPPWLLYLTSDLSSISGCLIIIGLKIYNHDNAIGRFGELNVDHHKQCPIHKGAMLYGVGGFFYVFMSPLKRDGSKTGGILNNMTAIWCQLVDPCHATPVK